MTAGSLDPQILLVDLPTLRCQVVGRALDDEGLAVVGVVEDAADLIGTVDSTGANFLIAGGVDVALLPDWFRQLIADGLPPDTLLLSDDGNALLVVVRPHCVPVRDLSVDGLIALIRSSVNERGRI